MYELVFVIDTEGGHAVGGWDVTGQSRGTQSTRCIQRPEKEHSLVGWTRR